MKPVPAHEALGILPRFFCAFVFLLAGVGSSRATVFQVGPSRVHTNLQSVARSLAPGDVVELDGDATYAGGVTFDNDGSTNQIGRAHV